MGWNTTDLNLWDQSSCNSTWGWNWSTNQSTLGVRVGSRQTLGLIWVPFKHDQSQITYITCPDLVKFSPLLKLNVQFHKLKTSRKQGSSWIDILLTLVVVPQRAAQIHKRNEFRNLFLLAMDLVSCRNFRRMTPNGPPPSNFKWGVINQTASISFIYPARAAWCLSPSLSGKIEFAAFIFPNCFVMFHCCSGRYSVALILKPQLHFARLVPAILCCCNSLILLCAFDPVTSPCSWQFVLKK